MTRHRLQISSRRPAAILLASAAILPHLAITAISAAEAQDDPIDARSRVVAATIHAGASAATVTRAAVVEVGEGVSTIRFGELPPSIDRRNLQARVSPAAGETGMVEILEVELRSVPLADPQAEGRTAEIGERLEAIAVESAAREDDIAVIAAQLAFLDAIAMERGRDAGHRAGGAEFDPGSVERQLEFLGSRRAALLAESRVAMRRREALERERAALERERGQLGPTVRDRLVADVVVAAAAEMSADVTIVYRTSGAIWRPAYRIHADLVDAASRIEYAATTGQWTGEPWREITLELSTADPSMPTAPPPIEPAFIDVRGANPPPTAADSRVARGRQAGRGGGAGGSKELVAAAEAIDSGLSVAYRLPRPISLPSDRGESQRFRIDTIDAVPTFVFVSRPRTGTPPSLRATLENPTDLVLLPGPASIVVDGAFVGETELPAVPGRGRFELFLGPEPRIEVVRQPVIRERSTTGLFGGGRLVTLANRIDLENRLPRPVIVELWDRHPVSRDDSIQVSLDALSRPLDQDAEYLERDRALGLMRWTVALGPAGAPESRTSISWTVRIAHGEDVETTPIPD